MSHLFIRMCFTSAFGYRKSENLLHPITLFSIRYKFAILLYSINKRRYFFLINSFVEIHIANHFVCGFLLKFLSRNETIRRILITSQIAFLFFLKKYASTSIILIKIWNEFSCNPMISFHNITLSRL